MMNQMLGRCLRYTVAGSAGSYTSEILLQAAKRPSLHACSNSFATITSSTSMPPSQSRNDILYSAESENTPAIGVEHQSSSKFNRLPRHLLRAKLRLLLRNESNYKLNPPELKKILLSLPFADDAQLVRQRYENFNLVLPIPV